MNIYLYWYLWWWFYYLPINLWWTWLVSMTCELECVLETRVGWKELYNFWSRKNSICSARLVIQLLTKLSLLICKWMKMKKKKIINEDVASSSFILKLVFGLGMVLVAESKWRKLTLLLRWLVGLKLIQLEQQRTQLPFIILAKNLKPILCRIIKCTWNSLNWK